MSIWQYIVIGVSLLAAIGLVWLEVKRSNRARLVLRVVAVIGALGSLVCLIIPPTYMRHLVGSGERRGIMLTEGYEEDSVKAYMKIAGPAVKTLREPVDTGLGDLDEVHVFGYGLKREDWDRLGGGFGRPDSGDAGSGWPRVVWHAVAPGPGLGSVDWLRQVRPGQVWQVQGQIVRRSVYRKGDDRAEGGRTKVLLTGFGKVLDSVVIGGDDTYFNLSTVPAQQGRAVYRIVVLSGKDTVEREQLPVEVLERQTQNILFLAGAPDPENRFLADWLLRQGYGLAMRTAISKEKYDKSWLNMPEFSLERIDGALLGRFDLVIADESELAALPAGGLAALKQQIRKEGLGLVVKGDSGAAHGFYTQSLSKTGMGKTLYGKGKMVYIAAGQPVYPLVLAGEQQAYGAWWSEVLGAAVRDEATAMWTFEPTRPVIGEPVRIGIQDDGDVLAVVKAGETAVYLGQDALLSFVKAGKYWPERAGWQQAGIAGRDSSWWYVWDPGDWAVARRLEKWSDTRRFVERQHSGSDKKRRLRVTAYPVQVEKVWFFVLFLLALGFLWVERKI